jgi:hypothetical protein
VASFYSHPSWIELVCDEDVQLIEKLVAHPEPNIRRVAVGALWNLGKARPQLAKQLALSLRFDKNAWLAGELFMHLDMGLGAPLEEFGDNEIDGLIEKLSKSLSGNNCL